MSGNVWWCQVLWDDVRYCRVMAFNVRNWAKDEIGSHLTQFYPYLKNISNFILKFDTYEHNYVHTYGEKGQEIQFWVGDGMWKKEEEKAGEEETCWERESKNISTFIQLSLSFSKNVRKLHINKGIHIHIIKRMILSSFVSLLKGQ